VRHPGRVRGRCSGRPVGALRKRDHAGGCRPSDHRPSRPRGRPSPPRPDQGTRLHPQPYRRCGSRHCAVRRGRPRYRPGGRDPARLPWRTVHGGAPPGRRTQPGTHPRWAPGHYPRPPRRPAPGGKPHLWARRGGHEVRRRRHGGGGTSADHSGRSPWRRPRAGHALPSRGARRTYGGPARSDRPQRCFHRCGAGGRVRVRRAGHPRQGAGTL